MLESLFLFVWSFFVLISNAYAQSATASASQSLTSFLPLILMFAALYFIMIRPQMKRQKEHRKMLENLSKGDEIITSGGLAGHVVQVGDTFVTLKVSDTTEVNVQKSAVTTLLPKGTL